MRAILEQSTRWHLRRLLASASDDKTVKVWDATAGAPYVTLEGHSRGVKTVTISYDGQLLAAGSGDGTVRLWNANKEASGGMLEGHASRIESSVFSPDGKLIAFASRDKTVKLRAARTGAPYVLPCAHGATYII